MRVQWVQLAAVAALAISAGLPGLHERPPRDGVPELTARLPGPGRHPAHHRTRHPTEFTLPAGDAWLLVELPLRRAVSAGAPGAGFLRAAIQAAERASVVPANRPQMRAVQLAYVEFAAADAAARAGRLTSRSTAPPIL